MYNENNTRHKRFLKIVVLTAGKAAISREYAMSTASIFAVFLKSRTSKINSWATNPALPLYSVFIADEPKGAADTAPDSLKAFTLLTIEFITG
ncbi:hypothetical protein V1477_004045 [Vespula maculifrons]|uniref:Uncharacterized protein n=1 Tax=Vespula maculifrons TaxID=7453 RepID=A0ABD2CQF7_VESMC